MEDQLEWPNLSPSYIPDELPNDEDLMDCITDAFGYNGELARNVLEGLRSHFIASLQQTLQRKTFRQLIARKNPYLYRTSGIVTIEQLVDRALTDFVSSSTEGTFGNALDWIARRLPGNMPATGGEADLQRVVGNSAEIYTIKSGPAGFNAASWETTKDKMLSAKTSLEHSGYQVTLYVGFVYGRKKTTSDPVTGIVRLASKEFWSKITDDTEFYRKLLNACGCLAPLYNADVTEARERLLIEATAKFADGDRINWDKILNAVMG